MGKKETTLLDSSLNTATFLKLPYNKIYKNYNIKVLDCKGFKQLYVFDRHQIKKYEGFEDRLSSKTSDTSPKTSDNNVLFKNVMRSKIKLQRLAKCNENEWKTFITLTFNENITDLSIAYKKFRNLITLINRYKKDFKWLCVPEFQKSGRVHYHLITNIALNEPKLILKQEYDGNIYYHLKHWEKNGFNCIETIEDKDGNDTKKLCGYISKYMTKSYIEDCFYNKNRYYCSQNLNQPKTYLIDLSSDKDIKLLDSLINNCEIIYENSYSDNFNNTIQFLEYKESKNNN